MRNKNLDAFTIAYIEALLWSAASDDVTNSTVNDISDKTLNKIVKDCNKFKKENQKDLTIEISKNASEGGHCFALSRNNHGSGFFDSDHFANDVRDKLQDAAKNFKEFNLYRGDDGKIYNE